MQPTNELSGDGSSSSDCEGEPDFNCAQPASEPAPDPQANVPAAAEFETKRKAALSAAFYHWFMSRL